MARLVSPLGYARELLGLEGEPLSDRPERFREPYKRSALIVRQHVQEICEGLLNGFVQVGDRAEPDTQMGGTLTHRSDDDALKEDLNSNPFSSSGITKTRIKSKSKRITFKTKTWWWCEREKAGKVDIVAAERGRGP